VSDDPPKPVITRTTKLSEVQRLLRERKPIDGRARMVRSIQQSMRIEGYDVAAEVVAKAVEDVFSARGWG
jgi:N-acetyl-anhydromuramyl-L-alanine amidase AmpD